MKRISAIILFAMIARGVIATAQMPEPRKPGAEEKNLAYFAGDWKLEGNLKPGPMGPGGKFSGTEHDEFMPGGFYLVSHSEGSSSMGKEIGLAVMGYDPEKKVYTFDAYNNRGEAEHATGTFDGTIWTWSSDLSAGGQTVKTHFILTVTSPTSYNFKFEISPDGSTWVGVMDGTATKGSGTGSKKK